MLETIINITVALYIVEMNLTKKKCKPCEGGTKPMGKSEASKYIKLVPEWSLKKGCIVRDFRFKDFSGALSFINKVGKIAEGEGHHPDILLHSWNRVKLVLSTHAITGISQNDFIVAAKVDRLVG